MLAEGQQCPEPPIHSARPVDAAREKALGQRAGKPAWRAAADEVKWFGSYASADSKEAVWYKVIWDSAYLRPEPKVESTLLGIAKKGDLLQAFASPHESQDDAGNIWVELTAWSRWTCNIATSFAARAFTLIDGTPWGAGLLLEAVPRSLWPSPDYAERAGLRWRWQDDLAFKPQHAAKVPYLCWWNPDPDLLDPESAFVPAGMEVPPSLLRALRPELEPTSTLETVLGACCLLKAAPPDAVESWLLYHLQLGFRKLYLFFDDTGDEALPVARQVAAQVKPPQKVVVHECSADWWKLAEHRSRFFRHRSQRWARWIVDTHERFHDVQCRQQLVVDLAIQEAHRDRVHWLLHTDIDELLYFPRARFREDAPAWFGSLPPEVNLVKFHNHECVPETLEVEDWFRDVTLFKVNYRFLTHADDPFDWKEWEEDTDVDGADSVELTEKDEAQLEEQLDKEVAEAKSTRETSATSKKKSASAKPKEIRYVDAFFKVKLARTRHMNKLGLQLPETPWEKKHRLYEERLQKKRQELGLASGAVPVSGGRSGKRLPEVFAHFNGYTNGKCAVRIVQPQPEYDTEEFLPMPFGVHSFMGLGKIPDPNESAGFTWVPMKLSRWRMDGPNDPVVLHYANCGFSYWVKKYEILGDFPDEMHGRQNTMRPHLASRDLVTHSTREQQEHFYKMFCESNLLGELPMLFSQGLVVRVDGARCIVERCRAERATAGKQA